MSICGTSVLIAICGFIYKGGRKPFVQKKSLHPQYFRKNNVQKITPLSLDRASSFACHESLLNINWRSYCFSTMVTRYRVGPFQKLRITNYTDRSSKYMVNGSAGLSETTSCSGSELFDQNITLNAFHAKKKKVYNHSYFL